MQIWFQFGKTWRKKSADLILVQKNIEKEKCRSDFSFEKHRGKKKCRSDLNFEKKKHGTFIMDSFAKV